MKQMLRISIVITFCLVTWLSKGQIVNCNPDPNGPVYIGGDALESPDNVMICTEMIPDPISIQTQLPSSINNSDLPYFPFIDDQEGFGACVHFAEIWYTFTYEINRLRGFDGGYKHDDSNQCHRYSPFYTYNFVNYGLTGGTLPKSGFGTIDDNGCPSFDVYYDLALGNPYTKSLYWMSGYEKYLQGMNNTITHCEKIPWDNTYESLNLLKHWLNDHNEGDPEGGVAVFDAFLLGYLYDVFPENTPHEDEVYLTQWGNPALTTHAMTIVGYDEDVCCFHLDNDNSTYMNWDIDGDGDIELSECEKGAFIIANSWDPETFGNAGFIYIPYKLFGEGLMPGHERASTCFPKVSTDHELTVKVAIEYPERKRLSLRIGCASDVTSTTMENERKFHSFDKQGGAYDMRFPYFDEIEIGLNFDYYLGKMDFGKIYFLVQETDSDASSCEGTINRLSFLDYRWNETFEIECELENVPIQNNSGTMLSINYDLIPHHKDTITSDLTLFSDMVSRFEPTVTNNSTLTVSDITIDMYESTITIEEGSSLVIKDNSVFDAKKGNCEIIINGNVQIGDNVRFIAQSEASLDIHVTDPDVVLKINNCVFENCQLNSNAESDSITNSNFLNSNIICHNIKKENYESAIISNNNFSDGNKIAIDLSHFNTYSIENNTIDNMKTGIMLNLCGDDKPLTQKQDLCLL